MQIMNNQHLSLNQVTDQLLQQQSKTKKTEKEPEISFKDLLKQKSSADISSIPGELRFSKHAALRLADRDITLSDTQMQKLNEAAAIAKEKGIKESLVVLDSLAFIVNIPNHTVVTAMDKTQTTENVYTNIDGAVIM